MLEGFELETAPLNDYERTVLVPVLVKALSVRINPEGDLDKDGPVTGAYAIAKMKELGYVISGPRWRKLIHHIRVNNLVPRLCASSKGYWVESDLERYMQWIGSIQGRIDALIAVRDSAIKDLPPDKQKTWG